jgi:hypothetical protein
MMKYKDFDIEDFLNDEFFIQWVKHPGDETDHFWLKWIAKNPDKMLVIQKAREIILFVDYKNREELPDQVYMDLYENIVSKSRQVDSEGWKFCWKGWNTFGL